MISELDFDAEEFEQMSASQRVRICKLCADRARAIAENTTSPHRENYLRIAAEWDILAVEVAR
jgi:hypothetical protein